MKAKLFALVCLLALVFGAHWAAHSSVAASGSDGFLDDELVVGLQPGVDVAVINARYGSWVIETLAGTNRPPFWSSRR